MTVHRLLFWGSELTFATKWRNAVFILASSYENSMSCMLAHHWSSPLVGSPSQSVALDVMLTQHRPQHHPSIILPLTSCGSLLCHHPSTILLPRAYGQQKKINGGKLEQPNLRTRMIEVFRMIILKNGLFSGSH